MSDPNNPLTGAGLGNQNVSSTSRTQSGRPTRNVENKEKFKKLVDRRTNSVDDEEETDDVAVADNSSIFDLAAKQTAQEQEEAPPAQQPMSPFDLIARAPAKKAKSAGMSRGDAADISGLAARAETDKLQSDATKARSFAQVRDDLSSVNPTTQFTVSNVSASVDAAVSKSPVTSQTLIDQIVDKLYTVKTGDVTDTIMTIKNPPVFAGSQLVVTSYDTAKGEFNIAFTNLTQEAKTLLDSQHANLMNALVQRGYVAHIVVTTTEPYAQVMVQNSDSQMSDGQLPGETIEQFRKRQRDEEREQA